MARKPMMAGNWKMNNAIGEAVVLTQEISNNWWKDWEDKVDVVICPPFVDLKPVKTVLEFDKTKPIVCVGESLAVRDEGTTNEYVCAQVKAAFAGVDAEDAAKCVVAYEPIWAIGTGRTATPEQAEEVCAAIRAQLAVLFGEETAQAMRILYGGSMNPGNVDALVAEPDIDGGLIGGASLKCDSFIQLVKAVM